MKSLVGCFTVLVILLGATACQTTQGLQKKLPDALVYQKAIEDAMYATEEKVYDKLVVIDKQNKDLVWKEINGEDYLLVVTWKQNISYYEKYLDSSFYNTGNYPIWITTAPELLNRMKKDPTTDVNRRLVQLLGLPPNATYSYFVEFWVKPEDLFRPCPDPEITDSKCSVCFPSKIDEKHITWINQSRIDRYYPCDLYDQYPWSQLGYTYDWNPKNTQHIGLSEFVIGKNKKIVVHKIYTTEEYLKQ
ncbi:MULTISPECIES: hypothetical protein [unclassified Aureispira]|uniref:hypothetical protein n=1 Tax=unclassified Aureispira TaxID=2649989 RepID=UPI000697D484|nr:MULTISPECIES: hypothetical protein [unclassified Aureispira]WMX16626.1 hypothetical protein QP953_09630 [Aureispira sp. CCB-E]